MQNSNAHLISSCGCPQLVVARIMEVKPTDDKCFKWKDVYSSLYSTKTVYKAIGLQCRGKKRTETIGYD